MISIATVVISSLSGIIHVIILQFIGKLPWFEDTDTMSYRKEVLSLSRKRPQVEIDLVGKAKGMRKDIQQITLHFGSTRGKRHRPRGAKTGGEGKCIFPAPACSPPESSGNTKANGWCGGVEVTKIRLRLRQPTRPRVMS